MSSDYRRTEGRGRRYDSVVDTIGDTPCMRINRLAPDSVDLYVKAEFFNPAASVKDRLAISIIEEAERSGAFKPGPDGRRSDERQHRHRPGHGLRRQGLPVGRDDGGQLLDRAAQADALLGAKVVLTPRAEKGIGMYKKAVELAEKNGWFLARQFETDANARSTRTRPAPRSWRTSRASGSTTS